MYTLYKFLTVILSPLISLYLRIRLINGKEDKKRFKERFGISTIKRPNGDILWFQCASVGEANSAFPLIDKILIDNKDVTVLITSGTITSAATVEKAIKVRNTNRIVHQYTPVDTYFSIKRFLKFWKPKALITVESEIWPNMIIMSHRYCEKVIIVNAKMSKKSFNRWKKLKAFKERIFDSVDVCYPQSGEDQFRFINLGIQNTIYLGNMKFSVPKLYVNDNYLKELESNGSNKKRVLFASVHLEEIDNIINTIKLVKNVDNTLFVVAIRHPQYSDKICSTFIKNGFNVKRKSKNEAITSDTNIYMYDEIGEMGTMFEFCKICVMCGAFVKGIGGHTPVEPANQSCAIITPPYMFNSKSLFKELEKHKGCIICSDEANFEQKIAENIDYLLENENIVIEMGENAKNTCEEFANVIRDVKNNVLYNIYRK